ncbi:conserved hypothetical protein [metagenome]|uniref:HNH nuclease domain-containing protein n=1 Tax=metagenome TaxID=256318 RepID=A0A2P2CCF0_9ZZZZ
MFEDLEGAVASGGDVVAALGRVVDDLAGLGTGPGDDVFVIDCLTQLERLKAATAAAQARLTERLDLMRRAEHLAAGLSGDDAGRGVAHEVALARRTSPHHGRRHLTLARALVHDLPETLAALTRGDINEHRAEIIARETRVLTREHRATVDATLAHRLGELGDKALTWAARKLSYELDHDATTKRLAAAHAERRVTSRSLPDSMALISAVVPAPEGTAVMLSLVEYAATQRALGDTRTTSQIMADIFCQRAVGLSNSVLSPVNVEVQVVMTAEMLLGDTTPDTSAGSSPDTTPGSGPDTTPGSHQAAHVRGYGPIPTEAARRLIATTPGRVFLRRLYANPDDNTLVAMDSRRRLFVGELRQLLVNRDGLCRTPWCNAPIRHGDHIQSHADGGPTSFDNGEGLCQSCNFAKQLPGWKHRLVQLWPQRHHVNITTPTGHRHSSLAPPLPVDLPA